jgi:hypothetical protein
MFPLCEQFGFCIVTSTTDLLSIYISTHTGLDALDCTRRSFDSFRFILSNRPRICRFLFF